MNVPRGIRRIPRAVWVLRAIAALGPVVAVWAAAPEGMVPSPFVVVVAVVVGVAYAFRPEHFVGPFAFAVVLLWWALHVGTSMPVGALVAAAALVASHVAGVLLGYGPPRMAVGAELVVPWVIRGALVWLAAPVVWIAARAYSGQASPTSFWLAGLAVALVGAVVGAVVVPTRDMQEDR
jgi:hypothetical protein